MATRRPTPPRSSTRRPAVTSSRRDLSPRVTSRVQQPTTGTGRVNRGPSVRQVFGPWGGSRPPANSVTRGVPAAPAAAPAAPAAAPAGVQYSLSNLPVDASYDQQIASLQKQRDEGIAGIIGDRSRTLSDYGFQEGPTGALTFDVNNPFSKSALMKKSYDTNRRSTAQTMGAGGQLYSGSFQNAQDLVNRNQLQSEDALTKNLQAFLTRNTGRQTDARTNYELAAGQAYGDRVGRFQTNPLYDPATADASIAAASAAAGVPAAPATRSSVAAGLKRRARLTGARLGRI